MAGKHEYNPLMDEESSEDIQYPEITQYTNVATSNTRLRRFSLALIVITVLSLALNILQLSVYKIPVSPTTGDEIWTYRSKYAGLEEDNIDVYWDQWGPYAGSDDDIRDHLWDSIDIDSGIVAVSKSWASEKGLPEGTTFPWDSDKSIYFVNAYHSMHCLKNVYRAFRDIRLSLPTVVTPGHVYHCLDQLLADNFCQADDTLRVTNRSTPHITAAYQHRQCRDWDALHQWTLDHPGCYRYGNHSTEDKMTSQLPRMRFCPEGSPELEKVRKYFGKGKDWKPTEEKPFSWFD
ncbi:hypothetical protein F4677DRAFT_425305 [Hypoxylon crocopeplum]|nr:hypothetical protein F4677DRAFT_425305 [Hypoxylon crocopeplum]